MRPTSPAAYAGSPPRAWGRPYDVARFHAALRFTPERVGTTPPARYLCPAPAVHPHARGDDATRPAHQHHVLGSPPRAWGRRYIALAAERRQRFTPTRVGTTDLRRSCEMRATVHPHARGDDPVLRASAPSLIGSPPRAWGRLAPGVRGGVCCRFTPTRVGTTPGGTAHRFAGIGSPPRAWGRHPDQSETIDIKRFTPTRVGTTRTWTMRTVKSSVHPHARGDDCVPSNTVGFHRRFTPTRVGTTSAARTRCTQRSVHPHARGDDEHARRGYLFGLRFTPTRVGTTSPPTSVAPPPSVHPHARGDDEPGGGRLAHGFRFTPTRVGTTRSNSRAPGITAVHPHARGDDAAAALAFCTLAGSPPRAWGRLAFLGGQSTVSRFTPTRVGTTSPSSLSSPASAVHPHARGDDECATWRYSVNDGSPPRAWGRRAPAQVALPADRFTPTRVGTTYASRCHPSRWTVHPHARGDDGGGSWFGRAQHGSPPRAWGRRGIQRYRFMRLRFTPTRVGTTKFRESA